MLACRPTGDSVNFIGRWIGSVVLNVFTSPVALPSAPSVGLIALSSMSVGSIGLVSLIFLFARSVGGAADGVVLTFVVETVGSFPSCLHASHITAAQLITNRRFMTCTFYDCGARKIVSCGAERSSCGRPEIGRA